MSYMILTEFEKTILLSLFILAKGSTKKYTPLEAILSKFPIRQRKLVKSFLEDMAKQELLSTKGQSYRINKIALKEISNFLVQGPKARI